MDYQKAYYSLIDRARQRDRPHGYVEVHHVMPKALFPDLADDPENIVVLTAREHFVAHLLLAKLFGGPMSFAANSMSLNGRYGSRSYEWLRKEAAAHLSKIRMGEANPMFGVVISDEVIAKRVATFMRRYGDRDSPLKGRPISDEHRQKIKDFQARHGSHWIGRSHSDETRKKISEAKKGRPGPMLGKPRSKETKEKLRKALLGRTVPQEVKDKISRSLKGRPKPPRSEEHKRNLAEANRRNALKRKKSSSLS